MDMHVNLGLMSDVDRSKPASKVDERCPVHTPRSAGKCHAIIASLRVIGGTRSDHLGWSRTPPDNTRSRAPF